MPLADLIMLAKAHRMTDKERDEQAKSFAYGNVHLDCPDVTKSHIDEAFRLLGGKR